MNTTVVLALTKAEQELLQQLQKDGESASDVLRAALAAYPNKIVHDKAADECRRLNQQVHLYRSILIDTEVACRALTSKVSAEYLQLEQA